MIVRGASRASHFVKKDNRTAKAEDKAVTVSLLLKLLRVAVEHDAKGVVTLMLEISENSPSSVALGVSANL